MSLDDAVPPDLNEIAEFLGGVPMFRHLDESTRLRLATSVTRSLVPAGEWLFHEGDEGDRMYVVRWGRLHVVRETPHGEPVVVQDLTSGGAFGELAMLTGGRRAASVRAVRDSELLSMDHDGLLHLLEDATFAFALVSALGLRLRESGGRTRQSTMHRTVLTVAPWSDGLPVDELVTILQRDLGQRVTVLLPSAAADDDPGEVAAHAAKLLDAHESSSDAVVLVTTPVPAAAPNGSVEDAWNDFCLRQADRVLVMADRRSAPAQPGLGFDSCDLVWCADGLPGPRALEPWHQFAGLRATHPLRSGSFAADAARCARRLAGHAVGLVLSGGGARALAHIGVLDVFAREGVTVDRLGGTSVGAFVSALAATGRTVEEVGAVLRAELVARRPFADYGVPRVALIRGHRAKAMFYRVFGDLTVEELPRSWFGITCDLVAGSQVVHRRGPLHRIVGASMALPGLAPPQWQGKRLHIDGGVLNNLPVDVMHADGEGPVVAVDVMRRWDRAVTPPGLPGIVDTIAAATSLGGRAGADANRELAVALITPALDDIGLLDWQRIDEIVESGRQAAYDMLPRIAALAAGPSVPSA